MFDHLVSKLPRYVYSVRPTKALYDSGRCHDS